MNDSSWRDPGNAEKVFVPSGVMADLCQWQVRLVWLGRGNLPMRLETALPELVKIWGLHANGQGVVWLPGSANTGFDETELVELDFTPSGVTVLVYEKEAEGEAAQPESDAASELSGKLTGFYQHCVGIDRLQRHLKCIALPAGVLDEKDSTTSGRCGIYAGLLESVCEVLTEVLQENMTLHHSLATLREQHESTEKIALELGRALDRYDLPRLSLSMHLSPSRQGLLLPDNLERFSVRQRLAGHSDGFAGVELHVVDAGEGVLEVLVEVEEDDSVLGSWRAPCEDLDKGWNAFLVPEISGGMPRTVNLRVSWEGPAATPLILSLAHPQFDSASWPETSLPMATDQPLAVKAWNGLPGSRLDPSPYFNAHYTLPSKWVKPVPTGTWRLRREQLLRARQISPSIKHNQTSVISYPGKSSLPTLRLHPVAGSVSLAQLPRSAPAGTWGAEARVSVSSKEGPEVEFALMLIEPQLQARALRNKLILPKDKGICRLSDWVNVLGGEVNKVSIRMDSPVEKVCDLYLATRLTGDNASFAWADWSDLTLFFEPA